MLAALTFVNLLAPGHPVLFGNWPFVSDLRTGAFTGGGGEEAIVAAAAAQDRLEEVDPLVAGQCRSRVLQRRTFCGVLMMGFAVSTCSCCGGGA